MKRATRTRAAGIILFLLVSPWLFWPKEQGTSSAAPVARKLTPSATVPSRIASERKHSSPIATAAETVDWRKRLLSVLNETDSLKQFEDVEELARDLPEKEWPVVLNLILLPETTPAAMQLSLLILQRWAERSSAQAAEWLGHLSDDSFSHRAFGRVAEAWANADLTGAVAWVEKLPDNGNKTAAQWVVAAEAAQKKEALIALKLASHLAPSPERDQLVNYSVLQWATTDRNSAVAWAGKLSDTSLRDEMLGKIAIEWGIQDPARAAAFAATEVAPGKSQNTAVVKIVRFWGGRSPELAAAWVEQFPESNLRDAAMESLIEVWARNDSARAGEWLSRLPTGRSRDAAAGAGAMVLAKSNPDQASQLAETIQDETLRASARERLSSK